MQDITEKKHRKLLASNRHLRYMWIPYTDTVVVVTNNPIAEVGRRPHPLHFTGQLICAVISLTVAGMSCKHWWLLDISQ